MNGVTGFPESIVIARSDERTKYWFFSAALVLFTVLWLWLNGAVWWPGKYASLWSSEVWSSSNSQHPLDPYTLTHTMFGILCFLIASLTVRRLPLSRQFFLAILAACIWEICENSTVFIERFRHSTAASDYGGDALVNSTIDIAACALGFCLAMKVRKRISILIFIAVEVVTMFWVRDNLVLNILMLLFPVESIRNWQLGI